jgi:hypothetical protein
MYLRMTCEMGEKTKLNRRKLTITELSENPKLCERSSLCLR